MSDRVGPFHGGWVPPESADGKYLFYTKSKKNGIWRVALSGGEEQQVVSNVAGLGSAYAVGKQGIYFIALPTGSVRQRVAYLDFDSGQVTALAEIPRSLDLGLTLSPDEKILVYGQLDHVNSDLMLVEHFH
jgi:sugar lactone lactonase YvrE